MAAPSRIPAAPLRDRLRAPARAEVPAAHLGLGWRPLRVQDADAVVDLNERCARVDHPVQAVGREGVADVLGARGGTLVTDSLGGFSDGRLEAYATVHLPPDDREVLRAYLRAAVAPERRGGGIGRALLEWQDARARQLLAADGRDLPARIATYVDEHLADPRRMYVAAGFSPKRTFQVMRRAVGTPGDAGTVPGVRVVPWDPTLDDAVRRTHNAAFADHWGSQPLTTESWRLLLTALEPAWSPVALAGPPGAAEVVGYAMTVRQASPLGDGPEGYTELVGVRRDQRGKGLARVLLGHVLAALAADGAASAGLDVDTVNPSGAHTFYERLGYRRDGAQILYTIEI